MKVISTLVLCVFLATTITGSVENSTRITEAPKGTSVVLIGNTIKLEWKFVFQPLKDLRRISIFTYNTASKAKVTIASKRGNKADVAYNPRFKENYLCDAKHDKNGVGLASILIKNIQFNQSGIYGIVLEQQQPDIPATENVVSLKVVDMVSADEYNMELKTVKSWKGRNTSLKFEVLYRGYDLPSFQWFRMSTNELVDEGISTTSTTSTLTIIPQNMTDFGEYVCKATSTTETIYQKFVVLKLEYSGPPTGLEYTFYDERVVHTVVWKQAATKEEHEAKEYMVEIWNERTGRWELAYTTKILSVSFPKLESTTKLRVCSSNEIGYDESSCSKPILLLVPDSVTGKPGERGQSRETLPCIFLIFVATLVSSWSN